jgi:hypothetical protein
VRKLNEIAITAAAGLILYLVPAFLMNPPPFASATGMVGGMLAFWLSSKRRYGWAGFGVVIGILVGASFHLFSHYTEGRMDPPEGIAQHLTVDVGLGFGIAALVLTGALGVHRMIGRKG